MDSRKMITSFAILVVVVALAITLVPRFTSPAPQSLALAESATPATGITVVGTGRVRIKPDMASVRLGANTQAITAQQAQQDNAQKMQAIIGALKGLGIADKDLQTSTVSLRPIYGNQYNPSSIEDSNRVVSYDAVNMVTVRITDLSKVGSVVDEAVKSGANTAAGIEFGLQDDGHQCQEALAKAVQDAQTKADAIAKAMGRSLMAAESATEESVSYPLTQRSVYGTGKDMATSASVPIEAGELEISATVRIVYGF